MMSDRSADGSSTRNDPGLEDTATRPAIRDEETKARPVKAAAGAAARMVEAGARAAGAVQSATARPASTSGGNPTGLQSRSSRRARLRLTRIDPWSVMKISFLLSIALGVVLVVAVLMVWSVLGAAGVWDSINSTVQQMLGSEEASGFDIEDYVGTSRVLGFTMIVAAVDVILLTAIATLGAFLYNMAAALLGGIEVTLAEDN